MKYRLPLFLLGLLTVNALAFDSSAFAAVEYVESKYFPKKGQYLDWIEANKMSNKGVRLARSGQYKQAIPLFQQAIQRYGHDYTYYENLGGAQHKSGNLERAESTTEIAARMAPRRWGPWFNLGLILTKQHEYKRALAALKKAKALKAPPAKMAGINRLITALELKLAGNSPEETEIASPDDQSKNSAATSAENTPPETPAPIAPDSTVAPLSPPSTSEKGN